MPKRDRYFLNEFKRIKGILAYMKRKMTSIITMKTFDIFIS